MNPDIIYNGLGLMGTLLFLAAYALLQAERLHPKSLAYSLMNLAGAVLILISLTHEWNLPAFLLEAAWGLISIVGVITSLRRKA